MSDTTGGNGGTQSHDPDFPARFLELMQTRNAQAGEEVPIPRQILGSKQPSRQMIQGRLQVTTRMEIFPLKWTPQAMRIVS